MDLAVYASFREKVAMAVTSRAELEKHLEPGDILITTNAAAHSGHGRLASIKQKILATGIRKVYGDAGHAALYIGDGRTVEMSNTLRNWRLENTARGKDVHVFRPTADAETRKQVADALAVRVKEDGKNTHYVKPGMLARALIEEFTGKPRFKDMQAGADKRFTCTNVIAAAYDAAGVTFNPNKSVSMASPTDFITSKNTTPVVSFFNPRRHDKSNRVGIEAHLLKKAASAEVSSLRDLKRRLKPGDILVTSPIKNTQDARTSPLKYVGEAAFKGVNRALYGDDAHASIYLGDGKALEMRKDLRVKSLGAALDGRDAKIVRPTVGAKKRELAVQRALAFKAELGDKANYPGTGWLLKLLAADTPLKGAVASSHANGLDRGQVTCSNTISTAYHGIVDFADKPHGFVTPKDLSTSAKVTEVAKFLNRKRWDKEQRQ